MRLLVIVSTILFTSTLIAAEPEPRVQIKFSDLTPKKQAELVETWKNNYSDSISGVPPVVGKSPKALWFMEEKSQPPVVEKSSIPLLAPKVVTSSTITYAVLRSRVEQGQEVLVAIGTQAPPNYIMLSDPPKGIASGLWRCFHNGKEAVMTRIGTALHNAADRIGNYKARWTYPGNLRSHLMSEMHMIPSSVLEKLTLEEMEKLHDTLHDNTRVGSIQPQIQYSVQSQPVMQSYYSTGGFVTGSQFCPTGSCPTGFAK